MLIKELLKISESYTPRSTINIVDVDSFFYGMPVENRPTVSAQVKQVNAKLKTIFDNALLKSHSYFKVESDSITATNSPFVVQVDKFELNTYFEFQKDVLVAKISIGKEYENRDTLIDKLKKITDVEDGDPIVVKLGSLGNKGEESIITGKTLREVVAVIRDMPYLKK